MGNLCDISVVVRLENETEENLGEVLKMHNFFKDVIYLFLDRGREG